MRGVGVLETRLKCTKMWKIHAISTTKTGHMDILSLEEDDIKNGHWVKYNMFL